MRKAYLILSFVLFLGIFSQAQTRLLTGQFSNQEGSGGNKDYTNGWSMVLTAGSTYRLIASADNSGDCFFRFRNTSSTDRRPNTDGDVFALTTTSTPYSGNFYDGSFNAFKITGANTSYRYVFKVNSGVTQGCIFEIRGSNVRTVSSVSRVPAATVFPGQTLSVTATLNGNFDAGQAVFLRYTNNSFSSSTTVKMTGSATTYSAEIPSSVNLPAANIQFYVFTSGDISGTIAHSDADLYTINLNNNSGANYSYTVANAWTTAANGNWNDVSTWTAGSLPPTNQPTQINHNVTVSANLSQTATITVSSGNSLSVAAGQILEIGAGIEGTGALSVSGSLQINSGGFTNIAPTYNSGSTLIYNSGNTYNASTEWTANATSGTGVPQNVQIGGGASHSKLQFNNSGYRYCNENLTVGTSSGSGYELLLNSSDLRLSGNYTFNNGSVNNNSKAVFFVGTENQTTSNTSGTVFFDYLIVNKPSADLILNSNATLNSTSGSVVQLLNAGQLDLNGYSLNLNNDGGSISTNGIGRTIKSSLVGASLNINGDKTITNSSGGTLIFGQNVTVSINNTGTGINFGDAISTLNGTLRLNTGTFVDTYAPAYGASSTLLYNLTGFFNRNVEWNSSSLQNVVVQGGFTLFMGTNPISELKMAGNLTIASGSTLEMSNFINIPLQVGGNVVNDGTLKLSDAIGGDLYLMGNFTNNSTFNCNGREVRFIGTTVQTISGSSTSLVIDFMRVNNSSGLALNRSVEVDNELRLDNGILFSSSSNLLILRNGASSTSGSATAFVSGPMRKIGNTPSSFVFSIGKGSIWARLGINVSGGSTTDAFTAEYFNSGAPYRENLASGLVRVSATEHWTLDRSGSTNQAALSLYWQSDTYSDINNASSLRVCRYDGSQWVSEGQAAISFGSSGNITSNIVSSFSPFTFGSTQSDNNPLPLKLTLWKGFAREQYNELIWKTESEINTAFFEVERSESGFDFQTVAKIKAGDKYQFKDYGFPSSSSYYRLKMVDSDLSFQYSEVLAIERKCEYKPIFVIEPNPIEPQTLRFRISAARPEKRHFEVFDLGGRNILGFEAELQTGINELKFEFEQAPGVYALRDCQLGRVLRFIVE